MSQLARRGARSLVGTSADGNLVFWSVDFQGMRTCVVGSPATSNIRERNAWRSVAKTSNPHQPEIAPSVERLTRQNDVHLAVPRAGDRAPSRRYAAQPMPEDGDVPGSFVVVLCQGWGRAQSSGPVGIAGVGGSS